jgi:DNA-binding IclR family transcriptional regulator
MSTLRQDGTGGNRVPGAGSGVGVLDRSVALLDLLAGGARTLRWLSDASGLPRPTAYRLLVALEAHRLVARDATGAFRLGPRLTELAVAAGPALDLAALAGPVLAGLHEATGESIQLYVRSGERRLCVAARDAGTGLRDSVPVGALLPLDAGSGGKVLLAWPEPGGAGGLPGGSLGGSPGGSPGGSAGGLDAELAAVRRRGWASSVAEREPGVASVSAPVLVDGALVAALCISGPASRMGAAPGRRLAPLVLEAAADLGRQAAGQRGRGGSAR